MTTDTSDVLPFQQGLKMQTSFEDPGALQEHVPMLTWAWLFLKSIKVVRNSKALHIKFSRMLFLAWNLCFYKNTSPDLQAERGLQLCHARLGICISYTSTVAKT